MASLNKVILMGRLGADPELKYTTSQQPVATLSVATSDSWTNKEGQREEKTEWHKVIVWGKTAENCAAYLKKGRGVVVEGSIQTRTWEDKDGQKRYATEIKAQSVTFLPDTKTETAEIKDPALKKVVNRATGKAAAAATTGGKDEWDRIPF